ncbi:hypothetical protein [Kyrpidia tusciae]|uniref:Uncharacterized protein n=1 Tax=Kyrpidia tusciae (strain DSM 2912 / NBRC 15312 / T2) TaxID=562970 RepID=D5WR13_KYRT2|nr:hypothetical protein [Kyrpidia tusciae]ADG04803.1 hypothetical protein Btus_0023 [Kyrpidia tusciae DSM 2912]
MNRTLLIMIVVVVFLLVSFGMSYAMEIFFRGKPKTREERKRVFIGAFIWWIFPLDVVGTKLAKLLHSLRWSSVKS